MIRTFLRWNPIVEGQPAPPLSLTAADGTWVRLSAYRGEANAVLVFFRSMQDDDTDAWLRGLQEVRQSLEDLQTAILGISAHNTRRLREYGRSLGLDYHLLSDPWAQTARRYRCSGRVRPMCKPSMVVVDREGQVAFSRRGMVPPEQLMAQISSVEGQTPQAPAPTGGFNQVRNPGQAADMVEDISGSHALELLRDPATLLLDVRTLGEFEQARSTQAVHIPVDEVPHRYRELGQTTDIICICAIGARSAQAAEFLTSIGCSNIKNVIGGMSTWPGSRTQGPVSQE